MLNPLLIHISHQWLENLPSLYYLLLFHYLGMVLRFFAGELSGNKSIDISVCDVDFNISDISCFCLVGQFLMCAAHLALLALPVSILLLQNSLDGKEYALLYKFYTLAHCR